MLKGKRILLGITGGIAAYKAAMLARLLVRAGADVRVAMTEAATRFVTPVTFQALSNQPVWSDLWDQRVPDAMGHIELSRDRELIVVAPASADFMAKVAHGLADDLLSTLCVARRCPLMLAPAMNVEMWENAATQRNLGMLRDDGVLIEGPVAGDQACGETGYGRMLEPAQIAAEIEAFFTPKRLAGKRALSSDVFISVAAVADYKAKNPSTQKIKKANGRAVTLELEENPDILAYVAGMKNGPFCVGFAAESEKLDLHAKEKRATKNLPLLAANLVQDALGADTNSIVLYDDRGEHPLGTGAKLELARKLVEHVAGMLPQKK